MPSTIDIEVMGRLLESRQPNTSREVSAEKLNGAELKKLEVAINVRSKPLGETMKRLGLEMLHIANSVVSELENTMS